MRKRAGATAGPVVPPRPGATMLCALRPPLRTIEALRHVRHQNNSSRKRGRGSGYAGPQAARVSRGALNCPPRIPPVATCLEGAAPERTASVRSSTLVDEIRESPAEHFDAAMGEHSQRVLGRASKRRHFRRRKVKGNRTGTSGESGSLCGEAKGGLLSCKRPDSKPFSRMNGPHS